MPVLAANVADVPQTVWSFPAAAFVVVCLVITTSSVELQPPCEVVHRNVFAPVPKELTEVVELVELEKLPLPTTTDHCPLPIEGLFADKFAELTQTVWLLPALAVVGAVI